MQIHHQCGAGNNQTFTCLNLKQAFYGASSNLSAIKQTLGVFGRDPSQADPSVIAPSFANPTKCIHWLICPSHQVQNYACMIVHYSLCTCMCCMCTWIGILYAQWCVCTYVCVCAWCTVCSTHFNAAEEYGKICYIHRVGGSKQFLLEGIHFGWQAIIDLMYQSECGRRNSGAARMVPKLCEVHVCGIHGLNWMFILPR